MATSISLRDDMLQFSNAKPGYLYGLWMAVNKQIIHI